MIGDHGWVSLGSGWDDPVELRMRLDAALVNRHGRWRGSIWPVCPKERIPSPVGAVIATFGYGVQVMESGAFDGNFIGPQLESWSGREFGASSGGVIHAGTNREGRDGGP